MSTSAPRRPDRILRPLRLLTLLACIGWVVWGTHDLRILRIPRGATVLYDFPPGSRALARDIGDDDQIATGDAVLYFRDREQLAIGRVVATVGEELELDAATKRLRRTGAATWHPWPGDVPPRLPARDELLVLTEDPAFRESGGVVPRAAVAARLVVALPF
jgi:hypothetical protein